MTVFELFSQGVTCVRRPDWSPDTWLELLPTKGQPAILGPTVRLHQRGKVTNERLQFIGGGKAWVAIDVDASVRESA